MRDPGRERDRSDFNLAGASAVVAAIVSDVPRPGPRGLELKATLRAAFDLNAQAIVTMAGAVILVRDARIVRKAAGLVDIELAIGRQRIDVIDE